MYLSIITKTLPKGYAIGIPIYR